MSKDAYLMIEFNCNTGFPVSIDCYSESEDEITMIGNEYIRISDITWRVHNCVDSLDFGPLFDFLMAQLRMGTFDTYEFFYKHKCWTVAECRDLCSGL